MTITSNRFKSKPYGSSLIIFNFFTSCLLELVSAFITTRNHDGKLKLLNPSHRLRELFEVAKLVTVFEMFDDEAEALRSF